MRSISDEPKARSTTLKKPIKIMVDITNKFAHRIRIEQTESKHSDLTHRPFEQLRVTKHMQFNYMQCVCAGARAPTHTHARTHKHTHTRTHAHTHTHAYKEL